MATSGELCRTIARSLGIPFETVREHLRNIRARPNAITFKGYGRGAAAMTPGDAARLLMVAAGSVFVKDSLVTLDTYSGLVQVVGPTGGKASDAGRTFEAQLEAMIREIAAGTLGDAPAYSRAGGPPVRCMALSMTSVVADKPYAFPKIAVVRRFVGARKMEERTFVPDWWRPAEPDAAALVRGFPHAGLVQIREVPAWAVAEIARSLRPAGDEGPTGSLTANP